MVTWGGVTTLGPNNTSTPPRPDLPGVPTPNILPTNTANAGSTPQASNNTISAPAATSGFGSNVLFGTPTMSTAAVPPGGLFVSTTSAPGTAGGLCGNTTAKCSQAVDLNPGPTHLTPVPTIGAESLLVRVNQQHSSFDSQSKSEEAHLQECKSRLPKKEKKMLSANNVLDTPSLIAWAIVGDVLNQDAPAYNVANSIEGQGRMLYRLSPTIDAYDSSSKQKQLYRKLADIPPDVQIDAINLCVNYRIGLITILEMKKRGIKYAFIQPGADHNDLIEKADELGIIYQRGCMIVSPLCELSEDEKRRVQEMKKSKESGCGCVIS